MMESGQEPSNSNMLADARDVVARQLGQCRQMADIYVERALKGNEYGFPLDHTYVGRAVPLVRLCAQLASTLARLKGEVRQRIVIERVEAPAAATLVGESRAGSLSSTGEGGASESAKRVVVDAARDDATS